jgi:hypothetical protein
MLVRLVGRLEPLQRVARSTALKCDGAGDPGDPVTGTRHVARAGRDLARLADHGLRLDEIAVDLERPSQPEAGVDQ